MKGDVAQARQVVEEQVPEGEVPEAEAEARGVPPPPPRLGLGLASLSLEGGSEVTGVSYLSDRGKYELRVVLSDVCPLPPLPSLVPGQKS